MAQPPVPVAPLTEDAFVADRQRTWAWFTGTTAKASVGIALLVIGLAIFLI